METKRKREHFKTNRICSSDNYELSIKIHREVYPSKWDILYEEISMCTPYYTFFGKKIVVKNKGKMNKAIKEGFKIHFE